MVAEALFDRQLDLGFTTAAQRGTPPLAEVRIGLPGTRVLAELMAIQHIDDRSKPYFGKSAPGIQRDQQWSSIAGRNTEHSGRVWEIQKAMREARRANALADRIVGADSVEDYYDEVVDPGAKAVLKDVLRLYVDFYGDPFDEEGNVYSYSTQIEEEVLAAFPSTVGDERLATFEGITAADLFELMLRGGLTLPGHPIEPRPANAVARKYVL
jgi:hypothetical protein